MTAPYLKPLEHLYLMLPQKIHTPPSPAAYKETTSPKIMQTKSSYFTLRIRQKTSLHLTQNLSRQYSKCNSHSPTSSWPVPPSSPSPPPSQPKQASSTAPISSAQKAKMDIVASTREHRLPFPENVCESKFSRGEVPAKKSLLKKKKEQWKIQVLGFYEVIC